MYPNCINPEDWVRTSKNYTYDEGELFGIKYVGSQAVGIVSTSATATVGLKFEQGASVASASTATGTNPGTTGVMDCSTTGHKTYHAVVREINSVSDWEAWIIGALPDDNVFSGATSDWVVASDNECQIDGGYAVLVDNTVADYMCAALTFNNQSSDPHGSDSQVLHELLQVKHTVGSVGTVTGLSVKVYACDDVAGTSLEILNVTAAGTYDTPKSYPTDSGIGEPIARTNTKRLAVKMTSTAWEDNSGDNLYILGRSYAFGSAVRKAKMWSAY